MTNEHGVKLDRNGYAPSIVQAEQGRCEICGYGGELARHEIFFGPYREKSKAEGLWVSICPRCHELLHGQRGGFDQLLKSKGQHAAMKTYGWTVDAFRERFGKNFL